MPHELAIEPQDDVRRRYQAALESFTAKVRQDSYIIAAILCGSLSHDQVWQKSDIDMILVGRDERVPLRSYSLVEDGINIHAMLYARSRFRKELESAQAGSFFHSYFSKSTLLFTTDDSITAYYDDAQLLGTADRAYQLMLHATWAVQGLAKAQKWLYIRRDTAYCFVWHLLVVQQLANVETLLAGEVVGREVIQQAMRHNPPLFRRIYFDVIDRPKTPELMAELLAESEQYLVDRIPVLFRPLLEFLAEAGGARTASEIDATFRKRAEGLPVGCEWLAERGVLEKVPIPLRLTEKSRATVDEAAYFLSDETRGA